MGKLPENFEDWRLPWTEAEFDSEKAARLVFNARKGEEKAKEQRESEVKSKDAEIAQLKTDLDDEKARKSGTDEEAQDELKSLRKELRELKEKKADTGPDEKLQAEIDRLKVVVDLVDDGLPKALALRVQGEDAEALRADGQSLAEAAGIEFGSDNPGNDGEPGDGGRDNPAGPPVRTPVSRLRTGNEGRQPISAPSDPAKAVASLPPLFG